MDFTQKNETLNFCMQYKSMRNFILKNIKRKVLLLLLNVFK